MAAARDSGIPTMVIGGGTNLIVSDAGFRGIVLRYRADALLAANGRVVAQAGAVLQDLVDFAIARGLKGLETLAGIPGSVGAAVYGNAGAYGHSISERVVRVRFFDGACVRVFDNAECEFRYRESIFKRHKEWIIFSTQLLLEPADAAALRQDRRRHPEGAQREVSRHDEVRGQHLQEPAAEGTAAGGRGGGAGQGRARRQGSGGVVSGTGRARRGWCAAIFTSPIITPI